ncbi:MAG: lipoate--protein ligase family protein [Isosphaeraceae bacterium]|nr:lipoate--protein ligase family protein [Isosphaeraceae bacterium]
MALDEALLDAIDVDPSSAAFRTYGWSEPTLSLGYFQKIAEAEADPRWYGVPIVRRPTGGGAIWHDRELTYALVVPRSHPLARRASDLYRAVHGAMAAALRSRGIEAMPRGPTAAASAARRPFLCFADHDPEDIIIAGGGKVVGSAQRRRPGAVLQHGSLLLSQSTRTPELPGLSEFAGPEAAALAWSEILRARVPAALGLEARAAEITPDERRRAAALEVAVYRNPAWTRRR